jgi:hypothetical protein
MKHTQLIPVLFFASFASVSAQTDDTAFLKKFESSFETGGAVNAQDFVPAELMEGTLHSVDAHAYNDGLRNTYFLKSGLDEFEITGTPALVQRIREIYALDYLRGLSKSDEFGKALAAAGKAKVESAVGIVKDPLGAVSRLPQGASRFFGRIGEGLKGAKSGGEDNGLANIMGVSKAKARLAAQLGVSPYTTNEDLQQELNSTARAMAGGGLVVGAATSMVGGPALSVIGVNQTMQDTLASSTPGDLRIINRKKLLALGVNRTLVDEFLMHPWYPPWHSTIITDSLARIAVNPTVFLSNACKALTAEDAFYFQRLAQILAQYHATATKLRSIRLDGGIITALDRDGTLVVPVSLDYAIWAERAARRAEEFAALAKSGGEIKGLALWTDGQLSERLTAELRKRHITSHARALDATAH